MRPRYRYNEKQAAAAASVSGPGDSVRNSPENRNAATDTKPVTVTVAHEVAERFIAQAEANGMKPRPPAQRERLITTFSGPAGQHRDLVERLTNDMRKFGSLPGKNRQCWQSVLQRLQDQVDAAVAGEEELPADDRPRWHIHATNTDYRVTFSMDEAVEAQRAGHAVIGVGVNHELQYIVQPGDEVGTWHRQLISGELIPVDVRPLSEWRKHHGHDEWGSLDVVA